MPSGNWYQFKQESLCSDTDSQKGYHMLCPLAAKVRLEVVFFLKSLGGQFFFSQSFFLFEKKRNEMWRDVLSNHVHLNLKSSVCTIAPLDDMFEVQ